MKRSLRWVLVCISATALLAILTMALFRGRAALESQQDLERPVEAPKRVSRSPAGDVVLTLDAQSQARIGLQVTALETSKVPPEKAGYARVLAPDSLVILQAELVSVEAGLAAARTEYERALALYQSVQGIAQRNVEAAKADFITRESQARAASRRLTADWGQGIAALDTAAREALVDRLVKLQAALARLDLPAGERMDQQPAGAGVAVLGADGLRLNADQVFDAPQVDAKLQGQGFFLLFESPPPSLRPGAVMPAFVKLPGEPREGVVIPRAAVVRFEGMPWVYVQGASEKFFRREAALEQAIEKGWFTTSGFAAGDRVVVTGAQALLSEELRYQIQLGEE